jgi:hypothetical protein
MATGPTTHKIGNAPDQDVWEVDLVLCGDQL